MNRSWTVMLRHLGRRLEVNAGNLKVAVAVQAPAVPYSRGQLARERLARRVRQQASIWTARRMVGVYECILDGGIEAFSWAT